MKSSWKKQGFSLVELMVVIAIIGIVASIGIPRYKIFQAKARQAEAKVNLKLIYTLQQAYYSDSDKYASFAKLGEKYNCDSQTKMAKDPNPKPGEDIGLRLSNCDKLRYTYSVEVKKSGSEFIVTASSGANAMNKVSPGCSKKDVWTINQDGVLDNFKKGVPCPD
jgi:prepilin-type N-terminal cleavage/methylation domain-containing protein